MRDFLYDFRRTFTGKFTIVMVILIVLATLGITYAAVALSSASSGSPGSTAYVLPEIYQANGGYNITDYVVNGYGQPVPDLYISTSITNSTSHVTTYFRGNTSNEGYLYFHYNNNASSILYNYSSVYQNGLAIRNAQAYFNIFKNSTAFYPNAIGGVGGSAFNLHNSSAVIYAAKVANPDSKTTSNLMLYFAAPNGTVMPSYDLYYNVSQSNFPPASSSGMTFYKTVGGTNHYLITLPLNATTDQRNIVVGLFNGTGSFVAGTENVFYTSVSAASILQSALELPYTFLIPIVGIFSAYFYYGKDKTSGVLESVVTRPVTKGRLFVSRFVGTSATFLVALLIAGIGADLLLFHYTGSLMPTSSLMSIVIGYLVEAIAFSGIMYIISQFVKSQGALLGIGIGLFFLFVFVWGIVIDLIVHFGHINIATTGGYALSIALSAVTPTFFPTMVLSYDTGVYPPTFATISSGLNLVTASSVGITLATVLLVGLFWLVVPSVISFLLARSRD